MALDFGIWDHFERRSDRPPNEQYEQRIQLVQRAEELGFYGYHVAEHHFTPLDLTPSPLVFLAALAERTTRIRIGSMVLVLPLYNPARLIQEICMVDQISNGRLMPSVGRGVRDVEHEWFGVDPAEVRPRFAEVLEILMTGIAAGKISHHGRFFDFDDVNLDVGPMQNPMPWWYAGSFEFAATHGMSVLGPCTREDVERYWQIWDEGRARGATPYVELEPKVGNNRHLYVADSDEEALAVADRAWDVLGDNFFATPVRNRELNNGEPVVRGASRGFGYGEPSAGPLGRGSLVAGSPATVRERLSAVLREVGPRYNYMVVNFEWGDLTHEEAMRSMELFAAEVMPALRELPR
jgi:alkanesulfonate monooxygenase SsuD/methylene tetrahydromethanopterin reductase-like flavin-dependent oxidoreductase (luciferase family)